MGEAIAVGGINKGTTGMPVGLFSIYSTGQSVSVCVKDILLRILVIIFLSLTVVFACVDIRFSSMSPLSSKPALVKVLTIHGGLNLNGLGLRWGIDEALAQRDDDLQFTPLETFTPLENSFLTGFTDQQGKGKSLAEFSKLREEMVKMQIEARGIIDKRVLEVMRKVKRHQFVPQEYQRYAYEDMPLPIGKGQTISQPYIVALMTELLALTDKEKILEIGTGSGYQAAILAELAAYVYTIEILPTLAKQADALLKRLGYKNVLVKCGDGYLGWEEYAPFDAIIVTCAPKEIPQNLVKQLADGGSMVIPVGGADQELILVEKKNNEIKVRSVIPVRFVPMRKE